MSEQVVGAPAPAAAPSNAPANQSNASQAKGPAEVPRGTTPPAAPTAPPELFEVKVNGQVRKYTREQLLAKASLGEAAHERFEKASQIEKRDAALREQFKKDPIKALLNPELGLTKEQIKATMEKWYKEEFIDPEVLNEDQKARRELERWKAQKEAEEAEKAEREKLTKEEQELAVAREEMQKEIISALEKSGLPKTRFTVARYAYWMRQNLDKGYDAPPEVIMQQVKDERAELNQDLIAAATPEQVVSMLGPDVVNKIRKYDLERLKGKFNVAPTPQKSEPRESKGRKTMRDVDNYFNELRRSK